MIKIIALTALFLTTLSIIVHPQPSKTISQSDLSVTPALSLNLGSPCLLHLPTTGNSLIDSGYYLTKIQKRHNNQVECP